MQTCAIIVPCYNEAGRLRAERFTRFLQDKPDVICIFVNDGSSDNTLTILQEIKSELPQQVHILSLPENRGKAEAVRAGLLEAVQKENTGFAGYLDADLSASPDLFYELFKQVRDNGYAYVFGSRIRMLGTTIKRRFFRHAAGRFIATLVDHTFQLGIYDTQCGAKCFRKEIIPAVFNTPFSTRWLFDVEIFLRIRKEWPGARGLEYPLRHWENVSGSKLGLRHFPRIMREIRLLKKNYRTKQPGQ